MTPAQAINHLEEVAACEPEDFEAIAVLRAATTREPDRGSAKWCAQQPGYLPMIDPRAEVEAPRTATGRKLVAVMPFTYDDVLGIEQEATILARPAPPPTWQECDEMYRDLGGEA